MTLGEQNDVWLVFRLNREGQDCSLLTSNHERRDIDMCLVHVWSERSVASTALAACSRSK